MLEHPKSDHTITLRPPIPTSLPTPPNSMLFFHLLIPGTCKAVARQHPRARKPKNNIDFGGGGLKSKIIDIVDLSTYILSEIVDNVRR